MTASDQTRLELVSSLNLLMRRRAATSDAVEKEQINASIDTINEQLRELEHASLLQSATIAAAAGAELEKVVATAHTGAFDAFVSQARQQIGRLRQVPGVVAGRRAASARPAMAPARRQPATKKKRSAKKVAKKKPVRKVAKKPAAKKAKPKRAGQVRR